ncbi:MULTISPECIES: type VI secretion system ATPase TssH [Chromobacteriaceae]|uniref:ATPase n=1 Tax=Pseudogulbenkiania ferrooxidans EGD-HP2 TaxID=1388764 RepID=A0ABP2XJ28_9NEIS|nr:MULTISPECIES: type VI secretion system ATPase TssH [Chromobacteriaceae]AVG15888.1 ClpV1 family T6SS ATPase [Chromobacterium vaccinii]ERE04118.1 ATPase [Pseudogulbenkiania ferrooxidans EGD-HP2]
MSVSLKSLIDRLTPTARQAIEQAASRALARTHFEIEIEHVLLAMFDQDDNAALAALRALGADLSRVERELDAALDNFRSGNTRNPVLSSWLPKWLEKAWLLASAEHGQDNVSTLDLLLALWQDDALKGALQSGAPALARQDAGRLAGAYAALRRHGGESASGDAQPTAGDEDEGEQPAAPQGKRGSPALDKYTIDLTAQAKAGKIDPILGRDVEIRQMIDILMRRRQNNPILTGEPGVGKTAVVEGLARKIVLGEVPPVLAGVTLRTLDLGLLQAGASVKGEFENRLRQVIDEVKASPVPIILFIDEAHTLIGAGGAAGQNDAANLLKPALARGELRTIAATTWAEYKKYFEKDAALARRFQVVKVEEPAPEIAVQMVRGLTDAMAKHHKVEILNEAVAAAVQLSSRYIAGRQLPDKAISVLDTACARVALSRAGKPGPIEDVTVLIDNIDRETAALEREEGHADRIAELQAQRAELEQDLAALHEAWEAQQKLIVEIDELKAAKDEAKPAKGRKISPLQAKRKELRELQKTQPLAFECVDESVIADVIAGWTGIPLGRMVSNELEQVQKLAKLLAERVIGQDHALEQIAERVQIAKANLEDPGKPKGVFLLVGPSGVGKTETALALAEALYGGERNLITINMSEYQEAHSVSGLKGSPPGYVGYGEGGVLTEAVRRKPYSVVLLDEVEKAHPDVLELFFQVFDKGVLEDSEGREVDFKNTIILLTSNAGTELVMRACEHGVTVEDETRDPTADDLVEILRPTLQKTFKPAFLGRLTIVPYFPISDDVLRAIVGLKLDKIRQRIADNHGAHVEFPEELTEQMAARCLDVDSGARNADAILTRTLLAQISNDLLARMASGRPVKKIAVALKGEQVKVKVS